MRRQKKDDNAHIDQKNGLKPGKGSTCCPWRPLVPQNYT